MLFVSTLLDEPPKDVLDISPGNFSFFSQCPILFYYGLIEHVRDCFCHCEEGNYEVTHPGHFLFEAFNMRF